MSTDFENLRNRVVETVKDVTSLDVVTLTGELKITPALVSEGKLDLKKLHASLVGRMNESSLEIVAYTHSDLDKDTIDFVSNKDTTAFAALLEHHRKTVENVHKARNNFIKSFLSLIK